MEFLRRRVRDGVVLRAIGKWLNAGVMESGTVTHSDTGTPQGGVISPLLANVFLHEVVDTWFANTVRGVCKGGAAMVRYADDMVIVLRRENDARRVFRVLPKRFGKYALTLHPEKTRMVVFRKPGYRREAGQMTFDFLGFTIHWGKTREGWWVVKQKTSKDRLSRTLHRIRDWCRENMHKPIRAQYEGLCQKLLVHYSYFGVSMNSASLKRVFRQTERAWQKWLSRRSRSGRINWDSMGKLLEQFPLPPPRITHTFFT